MKQKNKQEKEKLTKKEIKKLNKKKIRYINNILFKEFLEFKKNNPHNIKVDVKEYPPIKINKIKEKNKDLKAVDSFPLYYNLSNFQTIEGIYNTVNP
jgi:hypothetical protein